MNTTMPIIAKKDNEIQIAHLDEAIHAFVTGEIDYFVASAVADKVRENVFHIARDNNDRNYSTVICGAQSRSGPQGVVEYDDVKRTLLAFIDEFEAKYGFRSHEDPDRMFIYLGGRATANAAT